MKRKLLLATALVASALGMRAQTDVTSTYLTNADFSATTGWTQDHSDNGYWALGNGNIGTYAVANNKTSTTDDTHLAEECCIGMQCRWSTSYASFQQTKSSASLPAGIYIITYDVENTNTSTKSGSYQNHFYVKVGETTYNDTNTEWMSSNSSWTTHTISFTLNEATTADFMISFGYGLGSLNDGYGSGATPHLYVSHLKMTYTDPQAAEKAEQLAASKYTLNGYIKKATALNSVLSDATLTTAIETAQGVYDAATDFDTHNAGVVSASSDLLGAINTALSGLTPVALTNSNFNTTPNILADGSIGNNNVFYYNSNNASEAYNYNITSWTNASVANGNATFGGTAEYGTSTTICGTTPPATDMFGNAEGAALGLAAGWDAQSRYNQIKTLSSGRYFFYYEAYNQNTATNINANYFGASGSAGNFYGTTNSFVYDETKTFASKEWTVSVFEFDVATTADITIGVGIGAASTGSGNGAKLWIDNVLVYRIGDVMVTDADATAIIANVDALNGAVYNATDKSALANAKSTFESNNTLENYNALNEALIQAQSSVTAYTALDAAITNVEGWTSDATSVTDPIRAKYTAGTYSNETTAADIYEEYQTAELAALAAASATDYTSVILNPSFETGDMTGWSAESRNDTGVKDQGNATYSITSGDPVDGNKLFNSWGGTAENNVYQTIKGVPAGTYTLTALVAGFKDEVLTVSANETSESVTVTGDKTVGYTVKVVFTLAEAGDVVIKASNTKSASTSDASFIKADNFKLYFGEIDVTTTDYTALNEALNAAKAKTLGFENGEYAPYNNTVALAAITTAEALDQSVAILSSTLDAIIADLGKWTVNTAEVNAIYNGDFANSTPNTTSGVNVDVPGWTLVEGMRMVVGDKTTDPGLRYTDAEKALFCWGGTTITYGEQAGYTLPLKANTAYALTYKICGWRDGDWPTWVGLTVADATVSGNNGITVPGKINDAEGDPFKEVTFYFVTGEAKDYVVQISANKHFAISDISLVKAPAIAINESVDYTPANAAGTVTLTRTLSTTKWNTFVVPFQISNDELKAAFGDGVAVAEFSEVADGTNSEISFNTMETPAITPNKPVLLKPSAVAFDNQYVFDNRTVATGDAKVAGTNFDFVGTYDATTTIAAGDYFIASNQLWKSEGSTTIAGTRAYLKANTQSEVKVRFVINNETATSIEGIEFTENVENGKIYDISGRLVTRPVKGLYIKNGKKFIVK